jgi:hypothetical protein
VRLEDVDGKIWVGLAEDRQELVVVWLGAGKTSSALSNGEVECAPSYSVDFVPQGFTPPMYIFDITGIECSVATNGRQSFTYAVPPHQTGTLHTCAVERAMHWTLTRLH